MDVGIGFTTVLWRKLLEVVISSSHKTNGWKALLVQMSIVNDVGAYVLVGDTNDEDVDLLRMSSLRKMLRLATW